MLPGTQFGPYRVDSLLGAGGMGEVYLATDTRLDRRVAIKILGRELSGQATLRQRFEREAKLISKLNHPNICALYDVGRQDGVDFLVMEYLEGESLAQRLGRGPLPVEQVIETGIAIANALDRAHRQGIVHRDLKPGNVMLTKSGVKLLDFGLARLSSNLGISSESAATFRQELQDPLTQEGAMVGTFQYMSPEQIEGRDADSRSDIFSLGTVLYEMATGRRAFEGTSRAGVIAAILEHDPAPMATIRASVPPSLERLVRACVAKDPDSRIQSARDVALELEWMRDGITTVPQKTATRTASWVVAAIAVAAAIAGFGLYVRARNRPAPAFALSIAAPAGQTIIGPANISPDGRMVAFAAIGIDGTEGIWLRRLDDARAKMMAAIPRTDRVTVFWSPDSRWVGYTAANERMMRVRVEGGEPEKVASTDVTSGAAWSTDGTILFSPHFGSGLQRVAASGGEPVALTALDRRRSEGIHCSPVFLPDGRRFLYLAYTTAKERNRIYVRSIDGGAARFVATADALVGYTKPYLLFARDGALYAQKFDAGAATLSGEARRVVEDIRYREPDALALAWISGDGVLAYIPYEPSAVRYSVYDRSGSLVKTLWRGGELWMETSLPAAHLSPSGRMLLVDQYDHAKGAADVVVVDLARGIGTRITGGLSTNRNGVSSPDEQSVAFSSDLEGFYDVYVKPADESSPARLIWKSTDDKHVSDWSPDGKYLLVTVDDVRTQRDIWAVPLDTNEKPWPLVRSDAIDSQPRFSPDGKWIAYMSDESGQREIYVRPFRGGRALRVSVNGGRFPSWSRDGKDILFSTEAGDVLMASVRAGGSTLDVTVPRKLFSLPGMSQPPQFMPDGNILIGEEESKTPTRIDVTTAWKAKAP